MVVKYYSQRHSPISKSELQKWGSIGSALASDSLGRFGAMDGGISSLTQSQKLLGPARTVKCMVGDNSPLHAVLDIAKPGDIIVVDAGGFCDRAVWGGLMTELAKAKGIGGIVLDGAVRDSREIVEAGFNCFCRGVNPAGPHKAFGGSIDDTIVCGGIRVEPGDLIIGDADGVSVIPRRDMTKALAMANTIMEKESLAMKRISEGLGISDIYGKPEVIKIDD